MKATRTDQKALIELNRIDNELGRVRHELSSLTFQADIDAVNLEKDQHRAHVSALEQRHADIEKQIRVLDAQSQDLEAVIASKNAKLESGEGMDSRQLMVLQSEIEGHVQARDAADTEQLGLMEDLEDLEGSITADHDELASLDGKIAELDSHRLEAESELNAVMASLVEQRREQASTIDPKLVRAYDESRAVGGGIVIMQPDGTVDAGMGLSTVEFEQFKAMGEDEVFISEDTDAIVIRA